MDDTQTPSGQGDGAANAVSQLSESLAKTAESQRALVQEMTCFAKDESLRFVNLRLERNGHALDKLQDCHGIPGLIGVQQEWLRDLVQDYIGQNMRLAAAWRGLTQNAVVQATETATSQMDRMQSQASDMVHEAGEEISQMARPSAYEQETQH